MWFYGKMPFTAYMGGRSFAATPFRTAARSYHILRSGRRCYGDEVHIQYIFNCIIKATSLPCIQGVFWEFGPRIMRRFGNSFLRGRSDEHNLHNLHKFAPDWPFSFRTSRSALSLAWFGSVYCPRINVVQGRKRAY
jgi:hypothetical protein